MVFELLDPTIGATQHGTFAPRALTGLKGARVGVIWNGRDNGDIALRRIIRELEQQHELKMVAFERKPIVGSRAPKEIFDRLAAAPVDLILAGVGD